MPDDQQALPPSPPPSFGADLRKEREIRGISLKEIADSTKISKRYLEAIEKDDYNILPAPVFTRGFVREYARYLGLNPDEAVNRYLHYRQELEQSGQVPRDSRREPPRDIAREPLREMRHETARETLRKIQSTHDKPAEPARSRIDARVVIFLLLVALIIAGVWLFQDALIRRSEPAPAAASTTNETVVRVLTPTLAVTDTATAETPRPWEREDLTMTIRASETSWISLEADGRSIFNSELREGEEQSFHARDRFVFRTIGNAGGIEVRLNDVTFPALGESGEVVRNRVFDREVLKTINDKR